MASAVAATTTSERSRADRKPCSVFGLPPDFFNSCRLLLLHHSSAPSPLPASVPESGDGDSEDGLEEKDVDHSDKVREEAAASANPLPPSSSSTSRWTCHTCKAEFESLQEQRSHFKSDLHRLNVKLSIAGKSIVKEEDFDILDGDPLFEDFDISSSSGSEDEVDKDSLRQITNLGSRIAAEKQKLYFSLPSGDTVFLWRCLLLNETEDIAVDENALDHVVHGHTYIDEGKLINRLKSLAHEPRDKSHLRIVLLASGGHFAGCVFDGNSVVAHKTFHRYVVRAKAGKKQSTKDASGKAAHSAGSALRRYNEAALKKEIQELLISWKPFIDSSSCIFIHAPSTSRQMLFDGEKPLLNSQVHIIRHVPLTVRRPTLQEAKRVYNRLISLTYEVDKDGIAEETSSVACEESDIQQFTDSNSRRYSDVIQNSSGSCSVVDSLSTTDEAIIASNGDETTPLHEAAKSGDARRILELLEQGSDPCIRDGRGRTPYMLATEKEVRNTFRRFMALNPDKWDWHAANVPSPLTKELEEAQAAKQAEKDAKRKAKAKELKKLKKAKEKSKLQAQAALSENATTVVPPAQGAPLASILKHQPSKKETSVLSKEEEQKRALEAAREKRAAAAERRMAALNARLERTTVTPSSSSEPTSGLSDNSTCSCCNASLAGKVPFHRYDYKYCSTSCMFVHKEMLQDG